MNNRTPAFASIAFETAMFERKTAKPRTQKRGAFFGRLPGKIAVGALAMSLMLSPVTASKAAANDDFGKALVGIAALAIIGKAIEQNSRKTQASRAPAQPIYTITPRDNRMVLPSDCALTLRAPGFGDRTVYTKRCLEQSVRDTRMPRACLDQIRTNRGPREVYDERCLTRNGFRTAKAY